MLNLAVQVSVQTEYLNNPKPEPTRKEYFRQYYLKNHLKSLTKRKAYYLNNKPLLWSNYFTCKKPYCLTCFNQGIEENQYKFCGDNCSVKYWLSIYSQIYSKKAKGVEQNVEQFSPHTRNDILNSVSAPDNSLHARVYVFKNIRGAGGQERTATFFPALQNVLSNDLNQAKQERRKRRDQAWRRLATKDKVAQTSGYTLPTYREQKSITELLERYGEYSYLTGKPLGNYYLTTLDIDLRKEEFPESMVARLEKNVNCLLNALRVSYDKTKKGLHVDILTPEPLPNEIVYYQGWGKVWNIGSIQSKGRYVVGEDQEKEFVKNGKWYWKAKSNEEIKAKLAKVFFRLGKQELSQKTTNNSVSSFRKIFPNSTTQSTRQNLQAKVLNIIKTHLTDFLKVFYWDSKKQKRGYFLLNTYQRPNILPILNIGTTRTLLLTQGTKHKFLNRLL